jgi:hypothetical protein
MQQMMECVLAKMDVNQAEMRANQAKTVASLKEIRHKNQPSQDGLSPREVNDNNEIR